MKKNISYKVYVLEVVKYEPKGSMYGPNFRAEEAFQDIYIYESNFMTLIWRNWLDELSRLKILHS